MRRIGTALQKIKGKPKPHASDRQAQETLGHETAPGGHVAAPPTQKRTTTINVGKSHTAHENKHMKTHLPRPRTSLLSVLPAVDARPAPLSRGCRSWVVVSWCARGVEVGDFLKYDLQKHPTGRDGSTKQMDVNAARRDNKTYRKQYPDEAGSNTPIQIETNAPLRVTLQLVHRSPCSFHELDEPSA